ncbi:MAG: DUF2339 domain-containing protein [Pseudomonadota bacterium]
MDWAWIVILLLAIPVTAIAALVMALVQNSRVRALTWRIEDLERQVAGLHAQPADTAADAAQTPAPPPVKDTGDERPSEPGPEIALPDTPSETADDAGEPADVAPSDQPVPAWGAVSAKSWDGSGKTSSDPSARVSAGGASPPPPAAAPTTRDTADFEARLGSRWTVIVGGLALALGGIFLVRYSIEAGLLGPAARIVLGALFSLALLGTGEWLRRKSPSAALAGIKAVPIPAVLTAAGTSSLFATTFAAHALYGFVGPGVAFLVLGAIALATMVLSALHGRALAGLGLVGAYAVPFFVSADAPNPAALYLYLAFVTISGFALARLMLWRWLAITASALAIGWGALSIVGMVPFDDLVMALYVAVLMALAIGFLVVDVHRDEAHRDAATTDSALTDDPDRDTLEPPLPARRDWLALIVVSAMAALVLAVNAAASHAGFTLLVSLSAAGAMLWAASRFRAVDLLAATSMLLAILVMAGFDVPVDASEPVGALAPEGPLGVAGVTPERVTGFAVWATGFGAVMVLVNMLLGRGAAGRDLLALAGSLGPVALLAAAYWRIAQFQPTPVFLALALGLAALNAMQTEIAMRRSANQETDDRAIGFSAAGSVAALCLGLTILLETGWLTVSLALLSAGLAWLSSIRTVAGLGPLAVVVAAIVVARTVYDPLLLNAGIGTTPILNWLLWAYGIPALAFGYAAMIFRKLSALIAANTFEALATVYAALLVMLQVHHLASGGDIEQPPGIGTVGMWVAILVLVACIMQMRRRTGAASITRWLNIVFLWIGLVGAALLVFSNPWWTYVGEIAGGPVINALIPAYLFPALAFATYALIARGRDQTLSTLTGIAALVLGFVWITSAVRWFYQQSTSLTAPSSAELYTYSVTWLIYGIALLATGLVIRIRMLRIASALIIVLAVLKVFLIDMAELEGVLRALSFIGLGLVLIAIGLVYQRLLLSRSLPPASPPPSEPQSGALRDAA